MIRKFIPKKPVRPNQHPAVDHLAKFVADELILDPRGFCRLSAVRRIYWDWCEANEVVHRRYQISLLLLDLQKDFGLTCGTVYLPVGEGGISREGKPPTLYALRGARLRHPALNKVAMPGHQKNEVARVWHPIIEGITPDQAVSFDASNQDDGEHDDDQS